MLITNTLIIKKYSRIRQRRNRMAQVAALLSSLGDQDVGSKCARPIQKHHGHEWPPRLRIGPRPELAVGTDRGRNATKKSQCINATHMIKWSEPRSILVSE
jgi:hypothetical protein